MRDGIRPRVAEVGIVAASLVDEPAVDLDRLAGEVHVAQVSQRLRRSCFLSALNQ